MAKAQRSNEQIAEGTKETTSRRTATFLAFAVVIFVAACLVKTSCSGIGTFEANTQIDPNTDPATRAKWAQRLQLPGLPNLHKVSDDLYRGAQPTAEGMKELEKLGVKTVVNLRSIASDREELKGTELAYEHIKTTALNLQSKDVVRFLQIVSDSNNTPVFVHCRHGADRTGTMCAVYRIVAEGWSKDKAIEEMTKGGFGFHSVWQNLPDYISKVDIDEIKRKAGLNE
jgi:tyrosine-protein phosphatase SIW14